MRAGSPGGVRTAGRTRQRSVGLHLALATAGWAMRLLGPFRYPLVELLHPLRYRPNEEERRRTAANHLRRDPAAGPEVAARRAARSAVEYVCTEADFLRASVTSAGRLRSGCDVRGLEHLIPAREGNAIVAMVHFGNWDMPASIAEELGLKVTTVMADYGSAALNDFVVQSRRRFHLELFSPHDAARGLLRALRSGRCVGLLCDIPEDGPTEVVEFCGGPVRFSSVPARLARRTGAPIIPVDCWRVRRRYRLQAHPPIRVGPDDDDQVATQRVATVLEAAIARAPEQWYPFHEMFVDGQEQAGATA